VNPATILKLVLLLGVVLLVVAIGIRTRLEDLRFCAERTHAWPAGLPMQARMPRAVDASVMKATTRISPPVLGQSRGSCVFGDRSA